MLRDEMRRRTNDGHGAELDWPALRHGMRWWEDSEKALGRIRKTNIAIVSASVAHAERASTRPGWRTCRCVATPPRLHLLQPWWPSAGPYARSGVGEA